MKKKNDTTFKQGSFEYQLQGAENHLVLTVNGSTLTINPNFQNGQFGIQLRDLTALPDGTIPNINYNNGLPNETVTLDDQNSPGVEPLGGTGGFSKNTTVLAKGGNDCFRCHRVRHDH